MFEADNSNVIRWNYGITRWKAMFETGTTNDIIGWFIGIPRWKDMFGTGTNATISVFQFCTN